MRRSEAAFIQQALHRDGVRPIVVEWELAVYADQPARHQPKQEQQAEVKRDRRKPLASAWLGVDGWGSCEGQGSSEVGARAKRAMLASHQGVPKRHSGSLLFWRGSDLQDGSRHRLTAVAFSKSIPGQRSGPVSAIHSAPIEMTRSVWRVLVLSHRMVLMRQLAT